MRKGRDIIDKPVVAYDSGEKIETIVDLIFDQNSNRLLGFVVDEAGWFNGAKVLPLNKLQAIGIDAVIVPSKEVIANASDIPEIKQILERNNILKGTRIMTVDGRDLGTMIDLYFDELTGAIEGYEASGGLFADAYSGRSFVPAPSTLKIGEDVAFVPSETASLMEEQVGGLKAAMQATGEKLQDASRTVTSAITNTVVDLEEQKTFARGKVAQRTVDAPGGGVLINAGEIVTPTIIEAAEYFHLVDELYRATGGSVAEKLGEHAGNAFAGLTNTAERLGEHAGNAVASLAVEQAEGRRVHRIVQTPEGQVIAAAGQIVSPPVIQRAKYHHQEQALLEAVGLSTNAAVQEKTGILASNTGEQVKEGAKNLWNQVKETALDMQDRSTQAIEQQRIKGALGRPVTRVILDHHDVVILNVGELITDQAIDDAREAGVLTILLDSVYTETPQLSLDELRAPEPGKAAL
jgi:uncharacterized protein YrrD